MPDTLKTSLCANRLFPTARLSGMGVADTSLCTPDSRMNSVLRVPNREMAPEHVILTQNRWVWTPGWSESHSSAMG